MSDFNFNSYLKNNPLLKETNGYGNYVQPEKMFGSPDRISSRDYDNMTDDELDAAEERGDLGPSNLPLGPDGELMEDDDQTGGSIDYDYFLDFGGEEIEKAIISLLSEGFDAEDILDFCKLTIKEHDTKTNRPSSDYDTLD